MSDSETLYYDQLSTEVGELVVAAGTAGVRYLFFREKGAAELPAAWHHHPAKLRDACGQLKEYLAGQRRQFDFPLAPQGTDFQLRVWQALREIPYGSTISYGELAEKVGSPKGYRAVGNANGRNPIVIVQACHRVVNGDGSLGGFSSGIHRKKFLLGLEKYGRIYSFNHTS